MWHRKAKSKISAFLFNSKTYFLLALAVLGLISLPLYRNIVSRYRINQEIKSLEAEIAATQGKNEDINKLITYLNSDQFVEQQARENLNLKKDGENVMVLRGLGGETNHVADPTESDNLDNSLFTVSEIEKTKAEVSNPVKWYKYFFK